MMKNIRLLFLHAHREASALGNELSEESDQFRFLRVLCFTNLKGDVGLIMVKESDIRISIPLDLPLGLPSPFLVSFVRVTPLRFYSFPCTFSSVFSLSGTC